jgi:hypothetical protein
MEVRELAEARQNSSSARRSAGSTGSRSGQRMGAGVHTFGYHHIRKSPGNPPRMLINE